jgi:hypothetical protein
MRFILANHRDRKKLTLTAAHSEKVDVSITLTLPGTRVITLGDLVCEQYADAVAEYVEAGTLTPLPVE